MQVTRKSENGDVVDAWLGLPPLRELGRVYDGMAFSKPNQLCVTREVTTDQHTASELVVTESQADGASGKQLEGSPNLELLEAMRPVVESDDSFEEIDEDAEELEDWRRSKRLAGEENSNEVDAELRFQLFAPL